MARTKQTPRNWKLPARLSEVRGERGRGRERREGERGEAKSGGGEEAKSGGEEYRRGRQRIDSRRWERSKGAWQWKARRKHEGEGGGGKQRGDKEGDDDKGKVGAGENGNAAGGTDIIATATGFNPSLGHGEEGGEGRMEKQSLNERKLESTGDDEDDIKVEVRKRARKRKYNGDRAKKDH